MVQETAEEYQEFFSYYARAIQDFQSWDDMCSCAYMFMRRNGGLVWDIGGTIGNGRIIGMEFLEKLIAHYKQKNNVERVAYLILLKEDLVQIIKDEKDGFE